MECRKTPSDKKHCFSCTGAKQRATKGCSSRTFTKSKNKHHTSISDYFSENNSISTLATIEATVIYPVAIIKVNGVICRPL